MDKITQNTKWGQTGTWTPFISIDGRGERLLKIETLAILKTNF
jgi:hypothetical protein